MQFLLKTLPIMVGLALSTQVVASPSLNTQQPKANFESSLIEAQQALGAGQLTQAEQQLVKLKERAMFDVGSVEALQTALLLSRSLSLQERYFESMVLTESALSILNQILTPVTLAKSGSLKSLANIYTDLRQVDDVRLIEQMLKEVKLNTASSRNHNKERTALVQNMNQLTPLIIARDEGDSQNLLAPAIKLIKQRNYQKATQQLAQQLDQLSANDAFSKVNLMLLLTESLLKQGRGFEAVVIKERLLASLREYAYSAENMQQTKSSLINIYQDLGSTAEAAVLSRGL